MIKKNDKEYTFDEVWYNQIQQQLDVMDPSPTSHSIFHGHIPMWWIKMSGLLDDGEFILNPTDFGLEDINWHLYPEKHFNLISDHLLKTCSCKSGNNDKTWQSRRCSCKGADSCTSLCGCQKYLQYYYYCFFVYFCLDILK